MYYVYRLYLVCHVIIIVSMCDCHVLINVLLTYLRFVVGCPSERQPHLNHYEQNETKVKGSLLFSRSSSMSVNAKLRVDSVHISTAC